MVEISLEPDANSLRLGAIGNAQPLVGSGVPGYLKIPMLVQIITQGHVL